MQVKIRLVREHLRLELGSLLKKRLRTFFRTLTNNQADESAYLALCNEIDGQLTEFFEGHPELDAEVDLRRIVSEALSPHVGSLEASAKTLQNLVSSYGEVVKGMMLSRDVVVRSKGRATLNLFPPGTRLRVRELRRMNGSLGGVELVVKE
ncbi:MAG: hypothetical protein Q8O76_06585 [Chloroflexota bacterium]|nr:hypothetical protein [Chloroflexota bacterium]